MVRLINSSIAPKSTDSPRRAAKGIDVLDLPRSFPSHYLRDKDSEDSDNISKTNLLLDIDLRQLI